MESQSTPIDLSYMSSLSSLDVQWPHWTCIITGCCLLCTVSTLGYNQCAHWASALIPVCTLDIFMSSVYTGLSSVLTGHKHVQCAHWICVLAGCNIYTQVSWWIWEILDKYPALVLHYSGGVLLLLLRFPRIIIFCALSYCAQLIN